MLSAYSLALFAPRPCRSVSGAVRRPSHATLPLFARSCNFSGTKLNGAYFIKVRPGDGAERFPRALRTPILHARLFCREACRHHPRADL